MKMKIAELVFDYTIYPRGSVDSQHVGYIAEAMAAGQVMPPIVVERKTKRIVDGFHRSLAAKRLYGDDATIECELQTYKSEAALFIDCVSRNAAHGRRLSTHDRTHCIVLAERMKIEPDVLAGALHITVEMVGRMKIDRTATNAKVVGPVVLKRTIRHMRGQSLTDNQVKANDRLSGMNQAFYVNQVIALIENDLLDPANDELLGLLKRLGELIDGLVAVA